MTPLPIRPMKPEDSEYLRDESRLTGQADSLSFPTSEQELVAIIQNCRQQGQCVTVQGARTGLTAAAVPQGGHVLNLSRMNRIRGLGQDDDGRFFIRVEPGVVLARLRKQLETRRFLMEGWDEQSLQAYAVFCKAPPHFFTPDPTETTASIGGMVACNASGARSYRYGSIRQHIRGMRVVLPDGQTLALTRGREKASGRRLVLQTEQGQEIVLDLPAYTLPTSKSAAGYYAADDMDAVDLFIGSDGTLGVMTLIELCLQPLPPVIWGATCFFNDEQQALNFVQALRVQQDPNLAAIEFFDDQVMQLLAGHRQVNPAFARLLPPPNAHSAIFCELMGPDEAAVQQSLFKIGDAMSAVSADPAASWVARTAFDRDQLTFFRHAAPECVNGIIDQRRRLDPTLTKLGTDMSVPDGYLADVLALYRQTLAESGLSYAIWGHIGNNHVHVNILPRNTTDYQAGKVLYRNWAEQVVAWGGSVAAEHGIGKLKTEYLALMFGPDGIRDMKRVKATLDPEGLLGRGNLFSSPVQVTSAGGDR